jgi:hypothetical protein
MSVEEDGEVILFGDHDGRRPDPHVDDLAVAVRNSYLGERPYDDPPGCTIDPRAGAEDPRQIQEVKVFGMPIPSASRGSTSPTDKFILHGAGYEGLSIT